MFGSLKRLGGGAVAALLVWFHFWRGLQKAKPCHGSFGVTSIPQLGQDVGSYATIGQVSVCIVAGLFFSPELIVGISLFQALASKSRPDIDGQCNANPLVHYFDCF